MNFPFDVDDHVEQKSPKEMFEEDRLSREGLTKNQWPAQIDRAALDIHYGIAIGSSDDMTDIGGTIGRLDFPKATGGFYIEGLNELAGEDSNVVDALRRYESREIGRLVYQLNTFRYRLQESGQEIDIDRALEAFLEKQATNAIDRSSHRDRNAGAGVRQLRDTDSVSDLIMRLFSAASINSFAGQLMQELPKSTTESEELLRQIDAPDMTTPLWEHQRTAMRKWIDQEQLGYVDMATATGKTVLGLAAIAYRYGKLHPADRVQGLRGDEVTVDGRPHVLIVAGNDVLLKQWRDEFDEHLDIPKSRTKPIKRAEGQTIELDWGDIDFRTAQQLLSRDDFSRYDLAILDEAHRYTRGSASGRGWRDLFERIVEQSSAVLAMSGSVDGGWAGDAGARDALENTLDGCMKFSVAKARDQGVIADFTWEILYAQATESDEQKIAEQTRVTREYYDASTGELDTLGLNVPHSKVPSPFVSYGDIRAFVQSSTGNELRESSKEFDAFGSALLSRRPVKWNAAPTLETIIELVNRHAPEEKTVVLVQSYEKAKAVRYRLVQEGFAEEQVVALEGGSDERHEKIQDFNELPGGVIIGPGTLLGVGVDMPDAEVAINISRGRVNASLVQRIGRVLRNPKGQKEAHFYHVVPQAMEEDAIDFVEDGARLLRQAAEFRALGETFKQPPAYETASQDIAEMVIDLENSGVQLLERVEETEDLVKGDEADEFVRRLQAEIYDAQENQDQRTKPVVATWNTSSEGTDEGGEQQFPKRNEAYERYRLTLGPYRAAKATAINYCGIKIEEVETESGYEVKLPEEYAGTAFHDALEYWLNEYRKWRDRCDNRSGEGEPGSLPEYKEEWPEPRDEDGALLTAEAAAEIGVGYAKSDPIFFPREKDGSYELPLPGDEKLTIDGIVERMTRKEEEPESRETYAISAVAVATARHAVEEGEYESLEVFVEDAVSDLLKRYLDNGSVPKRTLSSLPETQIAFELPDRHINVSKMIVDDKDELHRSVDNVVESAILWARGISVDDSKEIAVTVDGDLWTVLEYAKQQNEIDDVETFVENAIRSHIQDVL